ncbi:MAG: type II secretion system protein N [Rhodanobacteraceae bacterium]
MRTLGQMPAIDRGRTLELTALASCFVLGALALWLMVRLVWALIPRDDAALDSAAPRVAGNAQSVRAAVSIAKWHLFGNTPYARVAGPNAPATTLALVLRGTLANRDPHSGIAVIDTGLGREQAFQAGDEIGTGVKLSEVYPDHVTLLHDGAEEVLNLPRDDELAPGNIVRPVAGTSTSSNSGTSIQSVINASQTASRAPGTIAPAPNWQQAMNKLRVRPDALIDRVKLMPVLDNGKLSGVRLVADAAILRQAGLEPADVITAINGVPIDSVARGREVVESLKNAGSARVSVMRNGNPIDVNVDLSQGLAK